MPTTTFYGETNWQASSGPVLSRQFAWVNGVGGAAGSGDLWPVSNNSESDGAGDKDDLEDGLHPFVAIGPKALRPVNLVGVVMTYNANAGLAQVNLAPGFIALAYVANITHHTHATTYDTSLAIGEPVYVDDSVILAAGVTLSRSPLNDNADAGNPRAGYLMYEQNDYADFGVGGPNLTDDWPKVCADSLVYTLVPVMLWPDAF
jgi:hypothetical protein